MDYIDKENFIAFIDKKIEKNGLGYVIGGQLKDYINKQPAADVTEVKHGEWVNVPFTQRYRCSLCGNEIYFGKDKFCSECGAIMDGTPKERGGEK